MSAKRNETSADEMSIPVPVADIEIAHKADVNSTKMEGKENQFVSQSARKSVSQFKSVCH